MTLTSVVVANRGEIARRLIRTLRRLGIRAVALYTDADRSAPHVREADTALRVESYLSIEDVVAAALRSGAQAIHPGYGFLSENAGLARACAEAGLVFVGPSAEAIDLVGDKERAKEAAVRAGIPVLESYSEQAARDNGCPYPLLVKAAAGGGGRGMRVVDGPGDLEEALASARRESLAGFGSDRVFIERFLPRARHIEVQVIGDAHGHVIHLGERECSLQRRHQKVVEEAPSPAVSPELRERLGAEAIALAREAGYVNAGTVEFLADFDDPDTHFFLEMNARLQVEHPVTELVTGLDLVELQLLVASGEPLPLVQEDVVISGHAVEARITAEDATAGFLPAAGRIQAYRRPRGVRVDDAIERGSTIGTDYDSLIAKVIAHAGDRTSALMRLDRALADTAILGVTTTTWFLRALLSTPEMRSGAIDTGLLDRLELPNRGPSDEAVAAAGALIHLAVQDERAGDDPFARKDGWRLGGRRARSVWQLHVDGRPPVPVVLDGLGAYDVERLDSHTIAITTDGERREWTYAYDPAHISIGLDGQAWKVRRSSAGLGEDAETQGEVRAPMPGQVLLVPAEIGATVTVGDTLIVLESMKMELSLVAPVSGVVSELSVQVGDRVVVDQPVAHVEAAS
jgi:acetyl-CoA/propionyl-CoA carboxylase biotin carboxyl carrier protein